jgi:hypothetical protein
MYQSEQSASTKITGANNSEDMCQEIIISFLIINMHFH